MCFEQLIFAYTIWGPVSGVMNTLLWYADSKDKTIRYMAEMRLLLGLSTGVPGFIIALCTYNLV